MGVIIELPGPDLRPLRQGDLDGLCGLYAAINGVRLALAGRRPLAQSELSRLFACGVSFLSVRHQLACAILAGFEDRLWPELVDAVARRASRIAGVPVRPSRPLELIRGPSASEVLWVVEDAVARGCPVLVGLAGRHDHYTVVQGCTLAYLQLFDGGNLHRLARAACGVGEGEGPERHALRPGTLTVLEAG